MLSSQIRYDMNIKIQIDINMSIDITPHTPSHAGAGAWVLVMALLVELEPRVRALQGRVCRWVKIQLNHRSRTVVSRTCCSAPGAVAPLMARR